MTLPIDQNRISESSADIDSKAKSFSDAHGKSTKMRRGDANPNTRNE